MYKRFDQNHGKNLRAFFDEHFEDWLSQEYVETSRFNEQYDRYCYENNISTYYKVSGVNMNNALNEWAKILDCIYEKSVVRKIQNLPIRCKHFYRKTENQDLPIKLVEEPANLFLEDPDVPF